MRTPDEFRVISLVLSGPVRRLSFAGVVTREKLLGAILDCVFKDMWSQTTPGWTGRSSIDLPDLHTLQVSPNVSMLVGLTRHLYANRTPS